MILRNYYKAFAYEVFGVKIADLKPVAMDGDLRTSGTLHHEFDNANSNNVPYMGRVNTGVLTHTKTGIILGSGSTPPTFDDYKLDSRIQADTTSTVSLTSDADEGGVYISAVITLVNNSDTQLTISECGLYCATSVTNGDNSMVLLDRTVLDAPVTIPSGGVGQLTYTIRLNYAGV